MPTDTINWSDSESAAKLAAGNWKNFQNFLWYNDGKPPDADRWMLTNTHHRDSGLTDQSNAAAIRKALEVFEGDVVFQEHSHWAVGWTAALAIRVYDRDGNVTEAFRKYCELKARLEEYALLDETDYSQRQHDEAISWIRQEGKGLVSPTAPDNWPERVWSWLWDYDDSECQDPDDTGPTPSREAIAEALKNLGMSQESNHGS